MRISEIVYILRYLKQWVMAWNDWEGNIWITTALSLPNFQPERILVPKENNKQKNWYPNIIHKSLGNNHYIFYTNDVW